MSRYTELLRLDETLVANTADAYLGYAGYLEYSENGDYTTDIASCYLVSAVYRSLVNAVASQVDFGLAASRYLDAGQPYGKILAICSMDPELLNSVRDDRSRDASLESQFADALVGQYFAARQGEIDVEGGTRISAFPTGHLHIPPRIYFNAFQALREVDGRFVAGAWNRLGPVRDLLARAVEVADSLMADTYHWNRLLGTFIPYEPEILAACVCLCAYEQARGWPSGYLRELVGEGVAGAPLLIASEMLSKGRSEGGAAA
ncbi:MAG: hypothetical protein JST42_25740, partial [Bacteroidetes bacterium]|nr:hypothetical protein [Bacteroidota bacterium]